MNDDYQPNPLWAEHVRRLVDQAPPLTPAQISRLAILLQVSPPPPAPGRKCDKHVKPDLQKIA